MHFGLKRWEPRQVDTVKLKTEQMKLIPTTKVTFSSLDLFRGFAALWVVMDHATVGPISLNFPSIRHHPMYAFSIAGMLGVQIFFVISGFCITNAAVGSLRRGDSAFKFVRARLRRIYPPYLLTLVATSGMSLFALLLVHSGLLRSSQMAKANLFGRSPMWYLAQLTLTQIPLRQEPLMVVFWTLCYEVAFYAIIAVLVSILSFGRSKSTTLLAALHSITVVSLITLAIYPRAAIFPFDLWPQFGLGAIVYDAVANGYKTSRLSLVFALTAAAMTAYVVRFNTGGDDWHLGSRSTFAVAAGFALLLMAIHPFDTCLSHSLLLRPLALVGTFSYSLYLVHLIPLGVVVQLGHSMLTPERFAILYFAQLLAAIITAYIFFVFCERPFINRVAVFQVGVETTDAGSTVSCSANSSTAPQLP